MYKSPLYFLSSFKSVAILFRRRSLEYIFKMAAVTAILAFQSIRFSFFIYISPRNFLPSFESICLSIQKEFKIYFQDGIRGNHLGFRNGTISPFFLPTCRTDTSFVQLVHRCRKICHLNQIVDAARRMTHDARRTLTNPTSLTSCSNEL